MNATSPADDELLSSYLDGEANPDEVARIEADPASLARVAELRDARDLVATPVTPLSAIDIDRLVGTALDESETSTVVTGIHKARTGRSARRSTLVAVAAAVLLVAVAVPLINALDLGGDGDFDTASVEVHDDAESGDDVAADDTFATEGLDPDAAEAAPADDNDSTDDAAADDDATADMAAAGDDAMTADDDVSATAPQALSLARLDELDAVLDLEELGDAVNARYNLAEARDLNDGRASLFLPEPVDCAAELEAALPGDEFEVLDDTVLTLAGSATVVTLLEFPEGVLVLAVAPFDDCDPVELLEL